MLILPLIYLFYKYLTVNFHNVIIDIRKEVLSMWEGSSSLSDMQSDIEKIFEKKMKLHVRVCDIIDLSYSDYAFFISKIEQITTSEEIERYSLSVMVAWVAAYKYKNEPDFHMMIKRVLANLPQHHTKYILEAINSTCYDFQIDNYGIPINSYHAVHMLVKRHAGYDD